MNPSTPARRAPLAHSPQPTVSTTSSSSLTPASSNAGAAARAGHPAHGAGSWRPRVRSTTQASSSYATPANKGRRRTVSERSGGSEATAEDQGSDENAKPDGLDATPGLDYDHTATPSTGASSRTSDSLPITPGTPLPRYVPRGQGKPSALGRDATTTPSKSHTRHHTAPLHRSALGGAFEPPVEVVEVAEEEEDENEEHDVDDVAYGVRHLRLSTAANEARPAEEHKTPSPVPADVKFSTPQPSPSASTTRAAPNSASPTVRPTGVWTRKARGASPTPVADAGGVVAKEVGQTEVEGPRSCGSCLDIMDGQAVKIAPCAHEVCRKCFTSGMNVVCDVAGGIMRCPACTSTVEDFKTVQLAPSSSARPAPQSKKAARKVDEDLSDDGKPVLLRFDNASWDVTPEMVVNFLPAGALPDASVNPHPIHLLIHPADGKTKDFFFVEVVSKKAAAAVIKSCQSTVLGEGKRARPVTITISNALELQQEIQPYDAATLRGILALCQAAYSTKKSYIKRKSFPFLYLMSILTRADLTGLEMEALVTFQGAVLVIANVLESGAASPSDLALANALFGVLQKSSLLTPVVCGPYIGVIPGREHPLARAPPPGLQALAYGFAPAQPMMLQQQAQQQQQQQQRMYDHALEAQRQQQQLAMGQAQQYMAYATAVPPPPPPGLGVVFPSLNVTPMRI